MKIAVIGATGSTGSLVVDKALAAGHDVVAISRSPAVTREPASRFTVQAGDLTDPAFLGRAIAGCDAVISCLGQNRKSKSLFATRTSPSDLLRTVARATVKAIGQGRQRFVYLSAFGVGEDFKKHSLIFRVILRLSSIHAAYVDHAEAEKTIKSSSVRWTIVKPPGLTEADTEVPLVDKSNHWSSFETVSKTSLAAFLVQCAEDEKAVGKSMTIGEPT